MSQQSLFDTKAPAWEADDERELLVATLVFPTGPEKTFDYTVPEPLRGEIEVGRQGHGRIVLAGSFASHGEPARLLRNGRGRVDAVWLAGSRLLPEAKVVSEMSRRYTPGRAGVPAGASRKRSR